MPDSLGYDSCPRRPRYRVRLSPVLAGCIVVALGVVLAVPGFFPTREQGVDVDIHSGRLRRYEAIAGVRYWETIRDTVVSRSATTRPIPAPDWRGVIHREGGGISNMRFGQTAGQTHAFERLPQLARFSDDAKQAAADALIDAWENADTSGEYRPGEAFMDALQELALDHVGRSTTQPIDADVVRRIAAEARAKPIQATNGRK